MSKLNLNDDLYFKFYAMSYVYYIHYKPKTGILICYADGTIEQIDEDSLVRLYGKYPMIVVEKEEFNKVLRDLKTKIDI